jgi:hypothetical protein
VTTGRAAVDPDQQTDHDDDDGNRANRREEPFGELFNTDRRAVASGT